MYSNILPFLNEYNYVYQKTAELTDGCFLGLMQDLYANNPALHSLRGAETIIDRPMYEAGLRARAARPEHPIPILADGAGIQGKYRTYEEERWRANLPSVVLTKTMGCLKRSIGFFHAAKDGNGSASATAGLCGIAS